MRCSSTGYTPEAISNKTLRGRKKRKKSNLYKPTENRANDGTPSLSTLPPEIKLHIVKLVRQGSEGAPNLAFTAIRALALVNKEFAAMAQPEIWKRVDLRSRTPSQLLDFAAEIVPRHADFITSLLLPCTRRLFLDRLVPRPVIDSASEVFQGFETANKACRLLAEGIAKLPSLRCLDLTFDTSGLEGIFARKVESVADRIVELVVRAVSWTALESLSHFLATFSSVQHPELNFGPLKVPGSRELLAGTVGALDTLQSLVLRGKGVDPFLDAFAAQAWTTPASPATLTITDVNPLESLGSSDPLPLDSLLKFLGHLAPTLTSFSTDRSLPPSAHLSTLHLLHIHTLRLGRCPNIAYKTLHDLLVKHRGTLKDFAVQVDRRFSEVERRRLQWLGESFGISCRIEMVSSFRDSPPTAYSYSDDEYDDGWSGGYDSDRGEPFDTWERERSPFETDDYDRRTDEIYRNS